MGAEAGRLTRREFLAASSAAAGLPAFLALELPSRSSPPVPEVAATTLEGGGFLAAVRTSRPADVALQAWPTRSPNATQQSAWHPTNGALVAKVPLPTAGTPDRAWSWRALVRDASDPDASRVADVVRTTPRRPAPGRASRFTFAFGCCTIRALGPAFRSVLHARPQFLALIGDLGYPDRPTDWSPISQDYAGYVEHFARVLGHDLMCPITASMPIFAVQDDHDYGVDEANRATVRRFAAQAFADVMPGGRYPGRNYRSWSVGDADFFLTDNRRWKDPDDGPFQNGRYMSVLGHRQRRWLLDGLAASSATVKFVFAPMTLAWYWSRGEIDEVHDFIADRVSGTVVFLTGDKHAAAFARYTPRIWEFLASPMSNPTKHATGPRSSAVMWTENGTGQALHDVFGLVDVDTSAAQTCTMRLMRADGLELHRVTVPLNAR
jgi:phosphodiesterase/alkaline phosphatase D-like protein